MSNEAITWCSKLHPGKGPKGVLFCLADKATDHAGEDWTCFPSIKAIMDFTDYSRPAVERNLRLLWLEGYISRVRRRRADGKLGIYDYTLHREPERRAELKAARARVQDVDAAMETGDAGEAEPHVKMTYGPDVISTDATHHFEAQPCVKMMGQEPSGEPSINPHSGRAREPGDQGWEGALALWPESGRKRTDVPGFRAQWARCCGLATPARLMAAIGAGAVDPDQARGDYGWPGLHTWMAQERWRHFLPAAEAAAGEAPRIRFAGPEGLRAAILGALDGFELTLDRCGWDGRELRPPTSWAHGRLATIRHLLTEHGAELAAPGGTP